MPTLRARAAPALLLVALLAGASQLWQGHAGDAAAQAAEPPPLAEPEPRCELEPVRHVICVVALHRSPEMRDVRHNLYSIAWRPVPNPITGLHEALVVGGLPGPFGRGIGGIVLLYDGLTLSRIYDREGPELVDVAWSPDGSYAIVVSNRKLLLRVDPPTLGNPAYRFRDLWDDCDKVQVANCREAPFYGTQVSFNPAKGYAWITGSSLLQYDGSTLSVVEGGADIAYRAIAWDPGGERALLSALVCVEEGEVGVDVPCPANITIARLVPGRVLLADVATKKICEVFTYGRFGANRAEVNGITWDPRGATDAARDYALIYGDDNFRGTILRFDGAAEPRGQTPSGCPRLEHAFRWLDTVKEEGEFNSMAFNPGTGRFWVAAGAGQELWEGDGARFYDILGEHDITGGKGTIYYGIAWEPGHTFLLVSGFQGLLYKVVPPNAPFLRTLEPRNNTAVAGQVAVGGKAFGPSPFEPVERVEVRFVRVAPVVNSAGNASEWRRATVTSASAALPTWLAPWEEAFAKPGAYRIAVRGLRGGSAVPLGAGVATLERLPATQEPSLEPFPPVDAAANYTFRLRRAPSGLEVEATPTPEGLQRWSGAEGFDGVEVQVEPVVIGVRPLGEASAWRVADVTGTHRATTNWSLPWDTASVEPGLYSVQARATLGGNLSNTSNRTVQVVRPEGLPAPALEPLPPEDRDGRFEVRWSAVERGGVRYELEEAALAARPGAVGLSADFAFTGDQRLLYRGPDTGVTATNRSDGLYFYRVRARTATGVSPWSEPASIRVVIDSDADNFSDAEELARGSNPDDAASTPEDWDGDGVANDRDASPFDRLEQVDTDGDGIGDRRDAFPRDHRDWSDADNDTWGDNAEARLAANPFDAASTPETDDDGDGCLNKDEAEAKTDARDSASAPAFCALARGPLSGLGRAVPGGGVMSVMIAMAAVAVLAAAVSRARRLG